MKSNVIEVADYVIYVKDADNPRCCEILKSLGAPFELRCHGIWTIIGISSEYIARLSADDLLLLTLALPIKLYRIPD